MTSVYPVITPMITRNFLIVENITMPRDRLVKSADLVLHPVRLRILQAFLGDRALTTGELRDELPDVPAASLYRHVARLVDAGVLSVVAERRVRGAVERTYVLRTSAASVRMDELADMSRTTTARRSWRTWPA